MKLGKKNYGTGKFVYFMILYIKTILDNLTPNKEKPYTLLFDEPESFLHPGLIREVGFLLKKINEKINVIVATHSADFLQYFCTEKTDIFYKTVASEKDHKEKKFRSLRLDELKSINIFNRRKIFLSLMYNKIIFVEGENDIKLMEYILYTDQESKFTKNVFI